VLVLLDNAHNAEQVRPLLPGSPGCLVVVTSRDQLAGLVAREGARRVALDVLTPAEARALLARILGDQRVRVEPAVAAELARACGHLPLALRIAAANLTGHPRRGIGEYLAELGDGGRLAAVEVAGDEQTAVRAAFGLSYAALPAEACRLFRLLGLVPGQDFTPAAAAALAGLKPVRARAVLERLAAAHLVASPGPGRFAFHDLLRLYAAERGRAEDPEPARRPARARLLDWYLHAADAAARRLYPEKLRLPLPPAPAGTPVARFDAREEALAWLDAERPNLLAAVEDAAEHGPRPFVWLLSDVLRGYFWLRLLTVDWIEVARAGLAAAEADRDPAGQGAAHLSLGDVHRCLSRYDQAIAHYRRADALAREAGWVAGRAAALGNAYWRAGRLQEAAEQHRLALALDQEAGSLAGQAASLANLGVVNHELGRLHDAAGYLAQAIALDDRIDSRGGRAMDLTNLGDVCRALGRVDEARRHLRQALAEHRELADRDSEADTLRALSALECATGDPAEALELAGAALALARDTGNRRLEADALDALGLVHQRLGRLRVAAETYQQAHTVARLTAERYPEVAALVGLASATRQLGQVEVARCHAEQALALAQQAGYRLLEGDARTVLGAVELDRGRAGAAVEQARRVLAVHRETGYHPGERLARDVFELALGGV
jgi:tetratricopeptide (TPR) repeat protein